MNIPHVSPIGTSMVHLLGAPSCNPIHPSTTLPTTTQHTPESPCLLLPRDSKRLLLQGPDRSGRSSMVMNLAYASSCAATAPCHCLLRPCRCTNVVIYRKSQASPPPDDFPMPCRFTGHTKKDCNGHVQDDWDPDSLRRIRIEYVSSAHEILQDLLRMPGKPWQDQPTQAILIDDLDLICGNDNDIRARSSGGSESLISSMQTRKWMTGCGVSSVINRNGC